MKKLFKRTVGATVATAIVAATPLLLASPASAAPTAAGPAVLKTNNNGGLLTAVTDSNDPWTIRLDAAGGYIDGPDGGSTADTSGSCQSDGNNGGRAHTYIIPSAESPASLAFNGNGSIVGQSAGTGGTGTFRNNLFTTAGSAGRNLGLNTVDATIINIPNFDFDTQTDGQIPAGTYNVGIACIDLDEPIGATTTYAPNHYFNKLITVTYPAGDPTGAQITFVPGAVPDAPVATNATPGSNSASVAFTHAASDPATTSYTVTATTAAGGATTPVTATGGASPINVPGLSSSALYSFTVTATNPVGTSAASNAVTASINDEPGVQNLVQSPAAAPGVTTVGLDWDAPSSGSPTGYDVAISAAGADTPVVTGTSATIANVPVGAHTCTVTPTFPAPALGTPVSIGCQVLPNTVVIQEITATRPLGALVITQKCGAAGTAPRTAPNGGGIDDPRFGAYPYPVDGAGLVNATYPTYCGVTLTTGQLVTSGAGAGQFFRSTGDLAEVTVVDTRDSDVGWTATGTMDAFQAGVGDSFSGSQLGWTPAAPGTSGTFTDSSGNVYTHRVNAGAPVAPNTAAASGLSSGRPLAIAPPGDATGGGLGIAVLDAVLELLIPVTANNGVYRGLLTITVS